MVKVQYRFKKSHLEAYFWILSILLLALTNPASDSHYSLCLFKNLGIGFCPGCGLGHSIAYLFRGRLMEAWHAHPLGLLAIIILLARAIKILKADITVKTLNSKSNE